jgi:hypothetical protein
VNALGFYVQERKVGRLTRLQAGGRLRSYLDVWQEDDNEWQVKKFDRETWERRFAHIVEPTYEIADFLSKRISYFGDLDSEGAIALNHTLQHYRETGVWLGLPKVPEDFIHKLAKEKAEARIKEEREKRLRRIAENEKSIRKDPLDRDAWSSLPYLYLEEQRYKDTENALKMSLKADSIKLGTQYSVTYMILGKIYLAALSVSIRGKGIPILGYEPSNVTAETLGYSIDELRKLAKENLSKAYEMDKKDGSTVFLKELELALKAADSPSVAVFEELERYQENKRREDETQRRERLKSLLDRNKHKDEEMQEDL